MYEGKYTFVDLSDQPSSAYKSSYSYQDGYLGNGDFAHDAGGWVSNQMTGDQDWKRETILNDINNAYNAEQARINREWQAQENELAWKRSEQSAENAFARQKELAKNEYSYKIADLRKNGLNPYLSVTSGAVVPSAFAASAHSSGGAQGSSSGAHASRSGVGIASALVSLISSALRLAAYDNTPSSYTDYYSDGQGEIFSARTRIYK